MCVRTTEMQVEFHCSVAVAVSEESFSVAGRISTGGRVSVYDEYSGWPSAVRLLR
jgi:hypothetical protein